MNEIPLCFCGCNRPVCKSQVYPYNWNKFILGHNNNRKGAKGPPRSIEAIEKAKVTFFKNFTPEKRKEYSDRAIENGYGKWMKGKIHSKETNIKRIKTLKKRWQDPEYAKKMGIAFQIKPNKPEMIMLNLLNDLYPNEWKYTGDFSFMINGKSPDFKHNTQKKLIEVFGDYWHQGQKPQDRKDIFKKFGYETLIFWEKELSDMDYILFQLEEFNKVNLCE